MKRTKIIVKVSNESYNIDVEDFFDDPMMESCTRIVEYRYKTQKEHLSLPPFMFANLDRKSSKTKVYNTYIVLINAGLHKQAENLRLNFMKDSGIDLQKEPVKSK